MFSYNVEVTECQVVHCQTKSTAKQWTFLPMFSDPLALVQLQPYAVLFTNASNATYKNM